MYDVTEVLAHACDAIREFGYRKSDELNSTREIVTDRVVSGKTPSNDALEVAEKIREWLCGLDRVVREEDAKGLATNFVGDLERNCIPLALSGYAGVKHIGRLAYMPLAHEKYLERQERARKREEERTANAQTSVYVGEVGQKLTIPGGKGQAGYLVGRVLWNHLALQLYGCERECVHLEVLSLHRSEGRDEAQGVREGTPRVMTASSRR